MPDAVNRKIQQLPHLEKPQLVALWQEQFAKPPHPRLRRNLMIPILAYRLQEQVYGGLKPSVRQRLERLAEELRQNRKATVQRSPQLKAGSKLLRQWQGEMHTVLVTDGSFEYRGQHYQSLSEIARQITGTRWSGPAFFGLKPGKKERPKQ
jgi:hypothetical protein